MNILKLFVLVTLLTNCSNLIPQSKRSLANTDLNLIVEPTVNCQTTLLTKLLGFKHSIVIDKHLEEAIVVMQDAGIHITNEDKYELQWGSGLAPLINDNYIALFINQYLKENHIQVKHGPELEHFLEQMDSNELLSLVRAVSNKFKTSFGASLDVIDKKNLKPILKELGISEKDLSEYISSMMTAIQKQNDVVEIAVLLRLKNRQGIVVNRIKAINSLIGKFKTYGFLSNEKNKNLTKMVTEFNLDSALKVYTEDMYFYSDYDLLKHLPFKVKNEYRPVDFKFSEDGEMLALETEEDPTNPFSQQNITRLKESNAFQTGPEIDPRTYIWNDFTFDQLKMSEVKTVVSFVRTNYKKFDLIQLEKIISEMKKIVGDIGYLQRHFDLIKKLNKLTAESKNAKIKYYVDLLEEKKESKLTKDKEDWKILEKSRQDFIDKNFDYLK